MTDDERARLAERVRSACVAAAHQAYEQGGFGGLCAEGRWELALDAMRALPLTDLLAEDEADDPRP